MFLNILAQLKTPFWSHNSKRLFIVTTMKNSNKRFCANLHTEIFIYHFLKRIYYNLDQFSGSINKISVVKSGSINKISVVKSVSLYFSCVWIETYLFCEVNSLACVVFNKPDFRKQNFNWKWTVTIFKSAHYL